MVYRTVLIIFVGFAWSGRIARKGGARISRDVCRFGNLCLRFHFVVRERRDIRGVVRFRSCLLRWLISTFLLINRLFPTAEHSVPVFMLLKPHILPPEHLFLPLSLLTPG